MRTATDFVFEDVFDDKIEVGQAYDNSRSIGLFVQTGLLTRDQLIHRFTSWRTREIDEAIANKLSTEKDWPANTDVDKLDAAMQALSLEGLLDLSAIDGITDEYGLWTPELHVDEAWNYVGGPASGLWASVYYTWTDVLSAVKHGIIPLRIRGFATPLYSEPELAAAAARMAVQDRLEIVGLQSIRRLGRANVLYVPLKWERRHPTKPVPSRSEREMSRFAKAVRDSEDSRLDIFDGF